MRKKTRILSIILALITISCFLFVLGSGVFAESAVEKKSIDSKQIVPGLLKVTATTIEFHQLDPDCEYRITTNGNSIDKYPDWMSPEGFGIIFTELKSDTTYLVEARIAENEASAGSMIITTAKMYNFIPLIVVLALILIYEIVIILKRVSANKKLGNKMFAIAPIFVLGAYIPAATVIVILVELILIAIAALFVVNIRDPEEAVAAAKAEEEARRLAEEEAARIAAEEEAARIAAEEAARLAAEEEARRIAEEEAKRKADVEEAALKAAKIVRKELDGIKVLGNGELTKALTVKATVFSATAKEKIEAAGGKTEEV